MQIDMCPYNAHHPATVWGECPFAHSKEKAKRRDPRVFTYVSNMCKQIKRSVRQIPQAAGAPS